MLAAGVLFFASIFGIAAIFELKNLETRGKTFIDPTFRRRADDQALRLKAYLGSFRSSSYAWPLALFALIRTLIHLVALGIARIARVTEKQAHRLADLVSHKRGFERRETRSEFLRQVTEHKNSTDFDARG